MNDQYRIRTDGKRFVCEVEQDVGTKKRWVRVAFQSGRTHKTDDMQMPLDGEFYDSEKRLESVIQTVLGTSAQRVREWRTV